MGDTVLYNLADHVATITYNRPEALNAVNRELRDDLNAAFARFRDDDEAWVAIVTGAGRAFCVGADLRDGEGSTGTFARSFWEKPTLNSPPSGLESSASSAGSCPTASCWTRPGGLPSGSRRAHPWRNGP